MPPGYSGTPLVKKLGIKENFNISLWNPPKHYFDLFYDLPEGIKIMKRAQAEQADFIHIFCTTNKDFIKMALKYKKALKKSGMMWISWPKGSSSIPTDLKRDPIRNYLLSIGLVDVKVAAIDDDWSGLKFVYRTKDR